MKKNSSHYIYLFIFLILLGIFNAVYVISEPRAFDGRTSYNPDDESQKQSLLRYQDQEDTGLAGFQALIGPGLLKSVDVKTVTYGYVKHDVFYDTRQMVGDSEDQALLIPEPHYYDRFCQDINSRGQFHMTAIQSRFGFFLTGPEYSGGIKSYARIEADFRGVDEATTFACRLRLAYGEVIWPDNMSILFGEFWHPLFVLECYPHTIDFFTGAPVEMAARNPQLRFTKDFGNLTCVFTAASQSLFASDGPCGLSSRYIRNSLVPNFNITTKLSFGENIAGWSLDYKRLLPRLATNKCIKTDSTINSIITQAFMSINKKPLYMRSKIYYAQNATEQVIMGGYGVLTRDPISDFRTYKNINTMGAWFDTSYISVERKMEVGFFIGYTQKLTNHADFYIRPKTQEPITYGEFPCVDNVLKLAPRIMWAHDPIRFGFEVWYDRAVYGNLTRKANLTNLDPVHSFRFSGAVFYLF